jgi:hypothetical protein
VSTLTADRGEIARFYAALFKHAPTGSWISLRAFRHRDDEPMFYAYRSSFSCARIGDPDLVEQAALVADWMARQPEGVVFCPPIATFKTEHNAKTENLAAVLVISVECDERALEAIAILTAIMGPPTAIVASGGTWTNPDTGEVEPKLHAHWRLSQAAVTETAMNAARLARRLACAIVGGDATNNAPVHPIRWPGSWHRKAEPRMARIIEANDIEIDLGAALGKLTTEAIARGVARYSDEAAPAHGNPEKMARIDDVARWLDDIPNPEPCSETQTAEQQWAAWNTIGMAVWAATGGTADGLMLFHRWSVRSSKYDARNTERRWAHYHKHPPTRLGAGTLCHRAAHYRKAARQGVGECVT